eukprot:COSAG02_NODE_48597_length_332_cov_1.253219_1_plen_52_part_10
MEPRFDSLGPVVQPQLAIAALLLLLLAKHPTPRAKAAQAQSDKSVASPELLS